MAPCKPLTWTAMYRRYVPLLDGRYVKSRSDMQLINKGDTGTNLCQPEETYNGTNNLITPCGLIAWSFFNDTYTVRGGLAACGIPRRNPHACMHACSRGGSVCSCMSVGLPARIECLRRCPPIFSATGCGVPGC